MSSFVPQGAFYGLGLAGKSLESFQYAENVTSDNISNVDTPGASQQQVVLTEAPPIAGSPAYAANPGGTTGDGVVVSQVQRIYSESYSDLYRGANASQNYYSTQQSVLSAVQDSLGDPTSGINAQYTAFQSAVNALVSQSSTGSTSALGADVITQAQSLAQSLNSASSTITTQESSIVQQATTTVQTVNGILTQMAQLNGQIRASTAAGDSPNTYADQRDELIDQLSQYLSVQTSIQSDGSALVSVNGQALVNDQVAYQLSAPTIGTASNGAPTLKINFATNPPASASAAGIPLGSGQLAGLVDTYNNDLVPYGQQLDQFASSLASSVNSITSSSYTANGQAGSNLFVPIVANLPISAGNITVGFNDPTQLPTVLASTAAGTGVVALNSTNNTVDTAAQLTGNTTLANVPAAALNGTLTITLGSGVSSTFTYDTGAGGNSDSIQDFISNFNAGGYGVTASYDSTSQTIVFSRDPNNENLALQAQLQQPSAAPAPDFTITDSNNNPAAPNASLLGVLGAGGINNVTQNASNAFGANSSGTANALVSSFGNNVGVPPLQIVGNTTLTAGQSVTLALPTNSSYDNTVQVGQVLTIVPTTGSGQTQENVVVTGVSYNGGTESVTFTPADSHAAGGYTITSAQSQTLSQFYGNFITTLGLDTQTAQSGTTTQTTLATNINQARQSISGINLDEETQDLIQYQTAYTSAAQVINILNQNLQTIITDIGGSATSG